jgi:uncharacterized membrane protein
MPMSLWLAASLSADAMVDSLCFLFVAVTLNFAIADDRPMTGRRIAALLVLIAAVALAKTAYLPITLLALTIPARKFGGRKNYWLFFALALCVGLCVSVAWTLSTYADFVKTTGSPSQQMAFILHHPLDTAREYVGQLFSIAFLCSIIGKLGWYDTRLSRFMVAIYAAVLVWTAWMAGKPAVDLTRRQKSIIALVAIGIWLAVFALVDLAFTQVGAHGVTSLQGRYLIPLTPLVLLLLVPKSAARVRPRALALAGFSVCFNIYIVLVLCWRFYSMS